MTLSEEQKELIRSLFKTGMYGIKWDSRIVGSTFIVNYLEELEQAFNDEDLRMMVCYELSPYSNVQELLSASKNHGPYLIPINVQPKMLQCPIEVTDEGVTFYDGYLESSEFVTYDFLKKYYTWQDGTHCGKQGNDVFKWSCFSGVLTMNIKN